MSILLERKGFRQGSRTLGSEDATLLLLVVILQNNVLILAGDVNGIEHGSALRGSSLLPVKVNAVVVLVALAVEGGVVWVVKRIVLAHYILCSSS